MNEFIIAVALLASLFCVLLGSKLTDMKDHKNIHMIHQVGLLLIKISVVSICGIIISCLIWMV